MTASGGSYLTARRLHAKVAPIVFAVAAAVSAPANAHDTAISIPATTLDSALTILARATNAEIVSTEAGLNAIHTPRLNGSMSVRQALARLLKDTGFRAIAVPHGGYRIVRRAVPKPVHPPKRPLPAVEATSVGDIVVTGSKQRVPLLRYPGSMTFVVGGSPLPPEGVGNLTDAAQTHPILQSTHLGAGRDKIFVRGIADSSFNGSTQSTVSLYLDDVQINYSGPDPGLLLYDIKSVEILEGPQGTLYGSGAIGGVIRHTSNPIDLNHVSGSIAGGARATYGGAPGFDVAGMANLPILSDTLGVRAVAYRVRDGGYIDDARRGLSNINQSDTVGARIGVRFDPGDAWRAELSGAYQRIDTRDGQYAEPAFGPLTRRARIAQPFDNQLLFGRFALSKDWDSGLRFFSATGIVGYRSTDRFDATLTLPVGNRITPVTYTAARDKLLLSQETRLSRSLANGTSWVAGLSFISDRDVLSRALGAPDSDPNIIGVTNVTQALSGFGELSVKVLPRVFATAGARVTFARVDGEPSTTPRSTDFVKGRSTRRVDPTIALSWAVKPQMAIFARYQTGYRTGGLAVARGVGRVADYDSDSITVGEVGIRKVRRGDTGVAFSGSFSLARWHGIQADLINRAGQPFTANIGNARIETIEGSAEWIPIPGLKADGSFLYASNSVSGPMADQSKRNNRRLPETPPFAAHLGVSYEWPTATVVPRIGVTADYVGRSVLGTGDLFDISQGNYYSVGLVSGLRWKSIDISLVADNLTNQTGNRFAFGNPFRLSSRDQTTPLRPLNVRLGIATAW